MIAKAGSLSTRLLFLLVLGFLVATGGNAFAAAGTETPAGPNQEGCAKEVQDAQEAKSEAQTAHDVAITEEHIQKPDSTMATTCFNNLSGINASGSAGGGGTIFSGDFISASPSGNAGGVRADIQDALQTFYTGYVDAMGADSGLVDYTQTTLTNTTTCGETADLWTEVKTAGVDQGVPEATLTDLINGTIPLGANTDYTADWNTSNGTDKNFSGGPNSYQTRLNTQQTTAFPAATQYEPPITQTDPFCQAGIDAKIPGFACP